METPIPAGCSREVPKTNGLRCIIIVHNSIIMHGTDVEDFTIRDILSSL